MKIKIFMLILSIIFLLPTAALANPPTPTADENVIGTTTLDASVHSGPIAFESADALLTMSPMPDRLITDEFTWMTLRRAGNFIRAGEGNCVSEDRFIYNTCAGDIDKSPDNFFFTYDLDVDIGNVMINNPMNASSSEMTSDTSITAPTSDEDLESNWDAAYYITADGLRTGRLIGERLRSDNSATSDEHARSVTTTTMTDANAARTTIVLRL